MQRSAKEMRVTIALIVVNALAFLLSEFVGSTEETEVLIQVGGAYTPYIAAGAYWRLFTSMFLHAGMRHLLNNMLLLAVLGASMEPVFGSVRFLIIYLFGGLCGSVVDYLYELQIGADIVSVGASGCVYAILGAAIWVLLRNRGQVRGLSMWQLVIVLLFSLYYGIVGANVANAAHLGGLVGGFLLSVLLYRR